MGNGTFEVAWVDGDTWCALYEDGALTWQGHPEDFEAVRWLALVERAGGFHDGVEVIVRHHTILAEAFAEFEPTRNPRYPALLSDIGHGAFR